MEEKFPLKSTIMWVGTMRLHKKHFSYNIRLLSFESFCKLFEAFKSSDNFVFLSRKVFILLMLRKVIVEHSDSPSFVFLQAFSNNVQDPFLGKFSNKNFSFELLPKTTTIPKRFHSP